VVSITIKTQKIMGSYRDMMDMIGNFKHVPAVIASSKLKRYAAGGRRVTGRVYNHIKGTNPPIKQINLGSTDNPYMGKPQFNVSDPTGHELMQAHTSGGFDPGYGAFNPYTATMIGGGGLLDGGLPGGTTSQTGGGSGPGYKGLTPYGSDTSQYAHELINPRVMSMDNGGTMPEDPRSFEEILLRQLFQESRFKSDAVSPAGATSMAQIMPDAFKDGLKKGYVPEGTKYGDLVTNPKLAQQFQENLMNDLMSRSWNKGTDKVKQAKALAAYNMGPTGLVNYLNKQKAKGVDIYNSLDWMEGLNTETGDYVTKILLGGDDSYENEYKKLSNEFLGSPTTTETKSDPSGPVMTEQNQPTGDPYLGEEKLTTYRKGGMFKKKTYDNGGVVDGDEEYIPYSERYLSQQKGSFPRMSNIDLRHTQVNKDVYLSLSMARYYGYEGEIYMTSGRRTPQTQWETMRKYKKSTMHHYSKELQKIVSDSTKQYGWKSEEAEQEIVNWLTEQENRFINGEISRDEFHNLTSRHMDGAAADFVGDFSDWLRDGKSGKNKQASQFIKDFEVKVFDEKDHFHVSFNEEGEDISSKLNKTNQTHYNIHLQQFQNMSTPDEVSGTLMINMNPSHYSKEEERFFHPFTEPIEFENIKEISTEPAQLPAKATILPSYQKYQEYLKSETEKPGYQFAERISNMENYSRLNPTMSYDQYMTENPNLLGLDNPQPTVPVQPMTENRQPVTDLPTQGMTPMDGFVQTGNPYQDIFDKTMPAIQNIYGKIQENYPILPDMGEVINPSNLPQINTPTTNPPYMYQDNISIPYTKTPLGPEDMY